MSSTVFGYSFESILAAQAGGGNRALVVAGAPVPTRVAPPSSPAPCREPSLAGRPVRLEHRPFKGAGATVLTGVVLDVVRTTGGNLRVAVLRDDTNTPVRAYTNDPAWTISFDHLPA